MSIKIYDSLTKKKQDFLPLEDKKVKIYSCGVTVYDECHIGHARSLYIFDVIRRYLKYKGYDVKFVRNITDIDDKIINKAKESGISAKEVAEKYIASYYKDLEALGIEKADFEPKATESIPEMIKHIEALIEKGYGYVTKTGVYFSVRKFKDYGKLSGQTIDQMLTGTRKEPDETKNDPLDFALWKLSKPDEPSWDSPWGKGRPGWHIECSVMSQKFLKTDTLDIHAGGRDLIFPHHENEIAQSEALTGKPFAKYWIHHGLLTINSQKMAKSAGNFVTIKDFIIKHKSTDFLKLFFLLTHYAHPVDYSNQKIEEAKKAYEGIIITLDKCNTVLKTLSPNQLKEIEDVILKDPTRFANMTLRLFKEAMDDDFNTPKALGVLQYNISSANTIINYKQLIYNKKFLPVLFYIRNFFIPKAADIFGLNLEASLKEIKFMDDNIKTLIEKRNNARKNKDFTLADEIRKNLEDKGIILEDTSEGTIWRRKL